MRNNYLLVVLFVAFILVVGCTQQQIVVPDTTLDKQGAKTEQKINQSPISEIQDMNFSNNSSTNVAPIIVSEKNETNKIVELQKGVVDPYFEVDTYIQDKAWVGYTLFPDNHDTVNPRVVEVNMLGEVVWEYKLPAEFSESTNPGFDVELLSNNNIQIVVPRKGIFEIDKSGKIVWEYRTEKVSHDADRLENGNILFAFGNEDKVTDAQVREITPDGKLVWSWYAKQDFDKAPYNEIYDQGWTHTNAVLRMDNGNTLISPRNFDMLLEVDKTGKIVKTIGKGLMKYQHDPVFLPNGNLLFENHDEPNEVLEINPDTNEILWKFTIANLHIQPVRDANRLPNGNTLITGTSAIIEVTPGGEIVWSLKLKNIEFTKKTAPQKGFYKAERIEKIVGD